MLLSKAQTIFTEVKQAICYVPNDQYSCRQMSNCENSLLWRYLCFLRDLQIYVYYIFREIDPAFNRTLSIFYDLILLSLFGEFYQLGTCGEMASNGFFRFLQAGVTSRLELITVTNQIGIDNHCFILLNRQNNSLDVIPGETFVLFDTWPGVNKINIYDDKNPFKKCDFENVIIKKDYSLTIDVRVDGELHPDIWRHFTYFLQAAAKIITVDVIQFFIDRHGFNNIYFHNKISVNKTHQTLQNAFCYFIRMYEEVTKHAYEKYGQKKIGSPQLSHHTPLPLIYSGNNRVIAGILFFSPYKKEPREIKTYQYQHRMNSSYSHRILDRG